MTNIVPLIVFILSTIFCLFMLIGLNKILTRKLSIKKREIYEMGVKAKRKEVLPIKFHTPAIIFIFWACWLFIFIVPWIFVYQKEGLTYHLMISLLFLGGFFIMGHIISISADPIKKKNTK